MVLTAAVVAAVGPGRTEPDTDPTPAADAPTSGGLASPPAPPLPVTTVEHCPEADAGCTVWRTGFPEAQALTTPTAGADPRHVYVGATLPDGTGALYAIDPTNGIQLWRRPLPGPPQRPLLAPWGEVVVAHGDAAGGTSLRSFDPFTGEARGRPGPSLPFRATVPPVAAGDTLALAGPGRMLLRRSDSTAGTIVPLDGAPVDLLTGQDDGGAVFLVHTDRSLQAHAPDGSLVWGMSGGVLGTAQSGGRTAVLEPGAVVGIRTRDGELWRTDVEAAGVAPVVFDGEVLVVTTDAEIVRLSIEDGSELGRYAWPVEVAGGLTVHDGTLYAPTCAGVVAVDARAGRTRWTTQLGSPSGRCADRPVAAPGDGLLLVGVGDALYGLRP